MKKVSISLFAVAAIVVALASSFTSQKKVLLVSDWFTAVNPQASLSTEAIANFNTSPFVASEGNEITDECPSTTTTDKVCAIFHQYDVAGGNNSLLDQTDLDGTNPSVIRYIP